MSSTGPQHYTSAPPGWYPDPWAAGMLRWWSGLDWTAYTMSATRPPRTDGFAIGSLISSLSGVGPLGVVLGFIARHRIKRHPDRRTGRGMANAGIITGFVFTGVAALVVVLAVNGAFDETNADDYSGAEQEIARTIDTFESAWVDGDGQRVCSETFTRELVKSYDGRCASHWGEEGPIEIDIDSINVTGTLATATAEDDSEVDWRFDLAYTDGEWRIYCLESD